MARRRTHAPLDVYVNNRLAGHLLKEAGGAISYRYSEEWHDWENKFPISLSLPLTGSTYRGAIVDAVFANLLPDNPDIRRKVAERTGAAGIDAWSLLEEVGRDCVGAMQFLPEGERPDALGVVRGEPVSDEQIERLLANLGTVPLGIDPEHAFRISVAGAQEKTALTHHKGQWILPSGTTPTTHILKPQIGTIPTPVGSIDMNASVDNEHYCLVLLDKFGLDVARTEITTFGERRVLVVERFDRLWRSDGSLLRLPQEDFCQALGVPSSRKYQSTVEGHKNGPGVLDIMKLLLESDRPNKDRTDFFASQIIFWLIGATDGHAKNFSVFLLPGGRFRLTPFYDVLTVQTAFDLHQIPNKDFRTAMSVGRGKYKILEISGRHFVETGRKAGLGPTAISRTITDVIDHAPVALEAALLQMPGDFPENIHWSVAAAVTGRLDQLKLGLAEL